jgi:hypothetical protein
MLCAPRLPHEVIGLSGYHDVRRVVVVATDRLVGAVVQDMSLD